MSDDEEFVVDEWLSTINLSQAAAAKLKVNQLDDLSTLLLCRETHVDSLKLGLGDSLRLRAGLNALRKKHHGIPELLDDQGKIVERKEEKPVDVSKDLPKYTQRQVEELLAGRSAVAAGGSGVPEKTVEGKSALATLFGNTNESTVACIRDLMRDLLNVEGNVTNAKGEKALLPINFLSCVPGTQDSEDVIHSGKGINLVIQSSLRRVTPEKLTIGQWTSANARILLKLINDKKLSAEQLEEYLEYNQKIGDLLQLFTPAGVFMLDNNHRLACHLKPTKSWADIDSTLEIAHLRRKDDASNNSMYVSAAAKSGAASQPSSRRSRPCWMYNSEEGCPYGKGCRYDHVEGEKKPQRGSFYDRAPRFQQNSAVVASAQPSKGNP